MSDYNPTEEMDWLCAPRGCDPRVSIKGYRLNPLFSTWFIARPVRKFRTAIRYWRPRRLTLRHNPRIHAWLWWNF